MEDYYVYHQQIVKQRRRRRVVIVLLVLLVLVSIGVGAFYFLTGDEGADALPAAEPVAAEGTEPAAEPTAEPTAEPVPVVPAGYAPHRILPQVDTAVWDTAQPVEQTIDYEYLNTDFRMAALPMLGTVDFANFDNTAFLGESVIAGLGIYNSGLQNARFLTQQGGTFRNFVYTFDKDGNRVEANLPIEYITQYRTGTNVSMDPQAKLAEYPPDRIYIMCGTNTLVNSWGLEALQDGQDGFANMIEQYQDLVPGVPIYVMAITGVQEWVPTGDANHSPKPYLTPENILTANNILANIALSHGCYFVNTQEAMSNPDGTMRDEYSGSDGIHFPSAVEYSIMADYIATHVAWSPYNVYVGQNPYYIYGK